MPYFNIATEATPYVQGSDTSLIAAASVSLSTASLRLRILRRVRESVGEGMTCDEVEDVMKLRHQTASARIRELVQDNKLVDSGYRRLTRSNHPATVWMIPAVVCLIEYLNNKQRMAAR